MFFNDFDRLVGVDFDVSYLFFAGHENLDDRFKFAHTDAACARNLDVFKITFRNFVDKRVENGTCARSDTASRHADDDSYVAVFRRFARRFVGLHFISDCLDVGY